MDEPKPYVVAIQVKGQRVEERVTAYNISEALMQVSVRLTARGQGQQLEHVIDVCPDEDALAKRQAYQRELQRADVAALARDLMQTIRKPVREREG